MTNPSMIIHTIQAILSPVSVWATVKDGLIAGVLILAIIGFLAFIDVLVSSKRNK